MIPSAAEMTTRGAGSAEARSWIVNEAPDRWWPGLKLRQFWHHRELVYFFAVRDVRVRYKQAFLGFAWAGLQPIAGAIVFTALFHRIADAEVEGTTYLAFAMVGFGVWSYASTTLQTGTTSLVSNADLLTKVAFPRIVPPTAALLPASIDLAVALALATGVSLVAGYSPNVSVAIVGVPSGLAMLLVGVAGPVLCLSALLVRYRDTSVLVSFALQLILFASPVAYPPEFVPDGWRTLLYTNPLAGALGILRSGLLGTDLPSFPLLALSGAVAIALFVLGLLYFRRTEREFADII